MVFGLIIGLLWYRQGIVSFGSMLRYAVASTGAYFVAFHVAINLFDRLTGLSTENVSLIISGVTAGLMGAFLLALGISHLLPGRHAPVGGLPILVGGVAGALLPLIDILSNSNGGFLLFLVIWQGSYAASLAPMPRSRVGAVPSGAALQSWKGRA